MKQEGTHQASDRHVCKRNRLLLEKKKKKSCISPQDLLNVVRQSLLLFKRPHARLLSESHL